MFRAQQNAFDDVVGKATDENLTSENWGLIMEVVDKVASEENGGRDVVASMIKRLAHRNANVQLYTLELANALSQNCEKKIHKELASRAFTDALLRLANDRNTHTTVKAKILERMQEWSEMFKSDPDLGIMNDQYHKLRNQNPNLHPPSAPQKSRLTDLDRRKEDEELQMALKLSIQDKQAQPQSKPAELATQPASQPAQQSQPQAISSGTTAATVSRVRALFDFQPSEPGELMFKKGDIIAVLESVYKDWWKGSLRGQTGIFPLNYVEKLADPTPDELAKDAQTEAEVFAEIKNVEKLLTLLSTSNSELRSEDNDEITKLYQSTLAIRPKLIELIGKYSQKKDDFTQLNEKFIKARRDYDALLEQSMAQPAYGYGRPAGYPPAGAPPPQDPGRYYSPGPQDPPHYPPSSPAPYAPQNGPAPFYVVGGNAPQRPLAQEPTPRIPSASKPHPIQTNSPPPAQYGMQPQAGQRPQSTYVHPAELGTYDPPSGHPYSGSVYSQDEPYSAGPHQPPAQTQYAPYVPPTQQGQQPPQAPYEPSAPPTQAPLPPQAQQQRYNAYAPPSQPPTHDLHAAPDGVPSPVPMNANYPALSSPPPGPDARDSLPSQGGAAYRPFVRPGLSDSVGHGVRRTSGGSATAPGGGEDFYRQSAAY